MSQNQLSDYLNFNTENMVFSKPEIGNIPGQKINFKRVRIACKNSDGSIGDLIFSTPEKLHSFGLQESRDMATNKLNGYVLPICLWSRNGPTEDEKKFTETFNHIAEYCKTYLLDHKEDIEKYDLDLADLKKFNPLYWKMEKGKPVEGRGPMLYLKVLHSKKQDKINTIFVDEETNKEIDPFKILNKPCTITAAIKFESIFIGNKISLQVKLYEVIVRQIDNSIRGLLRPTAIKRDKEENTNFDMNKPIEVNIYNHLGDDDDDDDDEDDEDDNELQTQVKEEDDESDGSIIMETPLSNPVETLIKDEPKEDLKSKGKRAPAKSRAKK